MVDIEQMRDTQPVDSVPAEPVLDAPTGMQETGVDAFNKIMDKHSPAQELQDMVTGEGEKLAEETEAEGAALAEKTHPVVDSKDRERALAALKRAKTPSSMIESLDDQALTAWGLELAEDQAEVDRRLSQPQERVSEASNEGVEESAGAEQPAPAPAQASADLAEMLKPLEDYLDSDGTEVLANVIQKMAAGQASEVSQLRDQVTQLTVDQTLRERAAMWPQLADSDVREAARGKMGMLASTGEYTDMESLTDAAMQLLGHHQAADDTAGRTLERDRMRDSGRATVSRASTTGKPLTDDQRNRANFSEILDRWA